MHRTRGVTSRTRYACSQDTSGRVCRSISMFKPCELVRSGLIRLMRWLCGMLSTVMHGAGLQWTSPSADATALAPPANYSVESRCMCRHRAQLNPHTTTMLHPRLQLNQATSQIWGGGSVRLDCTMGHGDLRNFVMGANSRMSLTHVGTFKGVTAPIKAVCPQLCGLSVAREMTTFATQGSLHFLSVVKNAQLTFLNGPATSSPRRGVRKLGGGTV
jgi:hypothetical protein